jgi:hypothetical protein
MAKSVLGAMMVQEVVAVALLVAAFLFQEVAAQLGVVSNHFLDDRGATSLERYHSVAFT